MSKLLSILALFSLSSCLLQRVIISKMDTILEYKVSSTLELYVAQDRVLEKDVANFLNAQRSIAPVLTDLLKRIDINSPEKAPAQIQELLGYYRTLSIEFTTIVVKHIATLDASQRKTFYAHLKEQNEESYEKLKKDKTEEYHDRMEYFFGDLTAHQKKILKPHEQIFLDKDRQRLIKREAFQADLKVILETPSPDRVKLLTERFAKHQQESFTDTKHLEVFILDLCGSLTKEQKEHFEGIRKDFLAMIAQFAKTEYE